MTEEQVYTLIAEKRDEYIDENNLEPNGILLPRSMFLDLTRNAVFGQIMGMDIIPTVDQNIVCFTVWKLAK